MDDLLRIGAAYIRVSDERQDEYSPDSQLKKVREHAAKEGYQIPDEYVYYDDGISGRSTRGRDEFKRMISDAISKDHPFDKLYVWKLSRFSRSMEDSIIYKSMLEKKNVKVVSVSEPISNDIYGKLMERLLEWEAQFYSERLSGEVTRGMEEKFTRGEPTCSPPFGYYMKDKKWLIDEKEAEIVREAFRRFADGDGLRSIAADFCNRGIRTKRGGLPENRWIDYMINNPVYIGMMRRSPNGAKAMSKRNYHDEEIIIVNGCHEAIIPIELWNRVQDRIKHIKATHPKFARREQPIDYMLKGIVRCSACGGTLGMSAVISGKNNIRSLQCCNYARASCNVSHSISIPKLEKALIQGLEAAIESKQFTMAPKKPQKPSKDDIDYNKLIAVEERKLERARQSYLAEVDTIEQYAKNKEDITERINSLIAKRDAEAPKEEIDPDAFAKKVVEIVDFIKRTDVTARAKNEALRTIIEKIVYEKAKNNLAIYFHQFLL